jgi:hypothetical protein
LSCRVTGIFDLNSKKHDADNNRQIG